MHLSALYIVLASVIWGIDGFFRQNIEISSSMLIALEMTIAGAILLAFLILFRRSDCRKIRHVWAFVATVLLGGVAGSWFFIHALTATDSLGFVFVLIGLQPVFTIMTSALVLGERPKGSFYAFAATTIFASILLSIGDTGWSLDSSSMKAYLFAFLTAVSWGSSTTFGKIVAEHNSPSFSIALRFLITGVIAWGVIYFSSETIDFTELVTNIRAGTFPLIFIILVSNILGYNLFMYGLRNVPATIATIFELAFPLTGFVLDYMLYDVVPSPMKVVAAITILMSIVILPYCHFVEEKADVLKTELA